MVRARRIDNNQKLSVQVLRSAGFSVAITSALGNGFPDLVICDFRNFNIYLIELKDGKDKKLTPKEREFCGNFPVSVIHSIDELIGWVNFVRNGKLKKCRKEDLVPNE